MKKILKEAYDDNITLTALAKKYKTGRGTLRKKAKEIGLDFSKLKKGNKIDKELFVGRRYGKLTVVKYDSRNERGSIWLCQCDCGETIKLPAGRLYRSRGSAKSCGCAMHKNNTGDKSPFWKGFGELSSTKWSQIKNNAKKRGIDFDLTIEDAYNVFLNQDKKCNLSGLDIVMPNGSEVDNLASLDRIDSTLPYVHTNIQWVHKKINYMKHCLSQDEFIYFCTLVVHNKCK